MENRKKEFIKKSNIRHNDKYNYNLVDYVHSRVKVKIICPEHGEFKQEPAAHTRGDGCPYCGGTKKLTTSLFIKRAKAIHGDKYDYSLVKYITSQDKVDIICQEHGIIKQRPASHLLGFGCEICGGSGKLNTNIFILKAKSIHGNTFDYSETIYSGNREKVKIICQKHGEFEQTPNAHLAGNGCFMCKESKGEKEIRLLLEGNGISYISQHRFDDCRNILPLPFDFYLPEHNICIEYDGEHHFIIKEFFGGERGLKDRQKKDNIKTDYCNKNNIKLLRIKYNENIINKLNKVL